MKNLINLLRGIVELTARGPFPERLINLCAQQRVDFWGLVWQDEHTITFQIHRDDLKSARELGQRVGCEVTVGGSRGLPAFLGRFRRRYAFLVGLALSLAAVCVLSRFVFTVQVTGNETVPTAQILGELRRLGLRPGVYGPGLELKQIAQEALVSMEDLSWVNINLYGTRAEVVVREAVKAPELLDKEGCWDIVSQADGLILEVEVMDGQAVVQEGDVVLAGDVLISGNVAMQPPLYSDLPVRYYQIHSHGRVLARTWRTLTAKIPLTAQVKSYTGEERLHCSLTILGRRVDFFRNSSIYWSSYDKITRVYPAVLPGEVELPVSWTVEKCRAYETKTVEVDRDAAQDLLEEQLRQRLVQLVGEDGEVEETSCSARVQDGWLTVTLTAQCREEVGLEVENTQWSLAAEEAPQSGPQ